MNPASLSSGSRQPRRRRLRYRLSSLLAVLVLVLSAASARADLADQHYKRALKAYETKEYPLAIREFQAAYRARQLPRILLLIGQVYRKLGMASTALKFYQHYLRVDPNPKPDVKAEVDRYIAMTQAMLDPPEFEAPTSTAPAEPVKGGKRRKPTAAEEAAAAVAAAPSNVTSVTVPELYLEEGAGDPSRTPPGPGKNPTRPGTEGTALVAPPGATPAQPGEPGHPLLPATDLQAAARTTPPPAVNPPGVDLTPPPDKTATAAKPFYKQAWFWGVVGGVAGVAIITGVAVGAGQANALPSEILKPVK